MEDPHRGRSRARCWRHAHRVRRPRPRGRRPGDHLRGSRPGRGHELRGQPDRRRLPLRLQRGRLQGLGKRRGPSPVPRIQHLLRPVGEGCLRADAR